MTRRRSHLLLLIRMLLALCHGTGASRYIARASTTALAFAPPRPPFARRQRSAAAGIRSLSAAVGSDARENAAVDSDAVESSDDGTSSVTSSVTSSSSAPQTQYAPPWSVHAMKDPSSSRRSRFRQHVNPLSRKYQMSADLPVEWPRPDFDDADLPLYLDIGCGKGGFLLELVGRRHGVRDRANGGAFEGVRDDRYMNATKTLFQDTTDDWLPPEMNYLGLEIRPGVSQYARARVEKRGLGGRLSFVGCNANVDLGRLLSLYREAGGEDAKAKDAKVGDSKGEDAEDAEDAPDEDRNRLAFVSVQFPDPHFKNRHSRRRIITPELVTTLAKFVKGGGVVFLQSDVGDALEAMREKFLEDDGTTYFDEWTDDQKTNEGDGGIENPLGIPTEREVSVLKKGLPVYRTLFKRNGVRFHA